MAKIFSRRYALQYIIGSLLIGASMFDAKPAEAASLEKVVRKALEKAIGVIAQYFSQKYLHEFEKTIKDWSKDMKKNGVENADKTAIAVGSMTDAINKQMIDAENQRLKLETKPAVLARPFTGGFFASEIEGLKRINEQLTKDSIEFSRELTNIGSNSAIMNLLQYQKVAKERFDKDFLQKDLDITTLVTKYGYETDDDLYSANYHIYFQLGELYQQLNMTLPEDKASAYAKITSIYEVLHFIQLLRIRSKPLYDECISSLPDFTNERSILSKDLKGAKLGVSLVELRRFETERRWLNSFWHDELENATSFTSLMQEYVEQEAYSDHLLHQQLLIKEKINTLNGMIAINKIDLGKPVNIEKRESI
ncbi:hypothetical protein [Aeromonas hydrophila]|uniref:hypothetical protein n=1 Tax=Aeromonas hydrophila TaxID=644 RepID=UPI002B46FBD7|nr:hypothetical protein [Aeromonas hydrophila]